MSVTSEMEFLQDLGAKAGLELMSRFGSNLQVRHKADDSIVTDADLASEKFILNALRHTYPDDLILSEEAGLSSTSRTPGQGIWIVDPLDGTTNFANSYPFFCVSIARGVFNAQGEIEVQSGVVHDPVHKKSYVAGRGQGAYVNGKPIRASADRPMKDCFLVTGFAYHLGENLKKDVEFFLAVAQMCQSIRRDGAAALDLALVAEGIYDGYWESGLKPWDLAAGSLLVSEAGGQVRNYAKSLSGAYTIEEGAIISGSSTVVESITHLLRSRNITL